LGARTPTQDLVCPARACSALFPAMMKMAKIERNDVY
jgi:hypothetical protein